MTLEFFRTFKGGPGEENAAPWKNRVRLPILHNGFSYPLSRHIMRIPDLDII
jgi:hypothetical protein